MPATFLLFAFGANEDAAQQACHKLEGWKQAFRLDKKLLFKIDRQETNGGGASATAPPEKTSGKAKEKNKKDGKMDKAAAESAADVKLLVRLYFSDHEKLSHHRWIERIPTEEPFRNAAPRVLRPSDAGFEEAEKRFEELAGKELRQTF